MEAALVTPEQPMAPRLAQLASLELVVTPAHTGSACGCLPSVPPTMTKDPVGLGRGFPPELGKLPGALSPP